MGEAKTTPALEARHAGAVASRARYRVGLDPEAVAARLRRLPDVAVYGPGRFPDLGDPVPARRFVAEVGEDRFRMAFNPTHGDDAQGRRGFGEGGGMLPTLELEGRLDVLQGATEIELRLVRRRSARSAHRWAGFLVLASATLGWLALGSGALGQRAVVVAVALAFMSPAFVLDLRRALRERRERLELLALMERTFGPIALDDVEHSPYRNPRRPRALETP